MTDSIASLERTFEIGGNWKMHPGTIDEAEELATDISSYLAGMVTIKGDKAFEKIGITLFVPLIFLSSLGDAFEGVSELISLGAQNMHHADAGAFTGEHSPGMIRSIFTYFGQSPSVLIGHSERRHIFGETNEDVNLKIRAAYEHGMRPFLAIGETQEERDIGCTEVVLEQQLEFGLEGISAEQFLDARTVIAYEPVWAIGTGNTATPKMANEAHGFARHVLTRMYGEEVADRTSIQYGGSMKSDNAAELMAQPHIDGGLIGGASLNAASFIGIIGSVPLLA